MNEIESPTTSSAYSVNGTASRAFVLHQRQPKAGSGLPGPQHFQSDGTGLRDYIGPIHGAEHPGFRDLRDETPPVVAKIRKAWPRRCAATTGSKTRPQITMKISIFHGSCGISGDFVGLEAYKTRTFTRLLHATPRRKIVRKVPVFHPKRVKNNESRPLS